MAHKAYFAAICAMAIAAPLAASQPEPGSTGAPAAGPDARYCLKIEITGSRIEEIKCWTRERWAQEEVDVDKEWAENGVRVLA